MFSILLASLLAAPAPEVEVRALDGRALAGPLEAITDETVTLRPGNEPVTLPIAGLMELVFQRVDTSAPQRQADVQVILSDGSRVQALDYRVEAEQATLVISGGSVDAPTRRVLAVRLQPPSPLVDAEWERLLGMPCETDLLVTRKGKVLNYHKGVLHDVTDERVHFELDGDILPVKRSKVHGLVYRHVETKARGDPAAWLTDTSRSRWAVASLRLADGKLQWTTPGGLTLSRPFDVLGRLDFSGGKIVYLSDLKPESVAWTPYFGAAEQPSARRRFFEPRMDHALMADLLLLDEKEFRKGLALHSRAEMVYRLPGAFRRFKATVGIDDRVRPRGNVRLRIRGDEKTLFEENIAGSEPSREVELDLTGVRRLSLLVDFGLDGDVADHLDLGEARVVK